MYYKKNNKGQYWTGEEWSFSKAKCKMYESFSEVANTPKEGRIQMRKPDNATVYEAIKGIIGDNGTILKSFSIPKCYYNLMFGDLEIRVHWNKNNDGFSVGTTLIHPTQGKNQLWRNYCSLDDVRKILVNPREHIGLPYKRAKE
jgi:hypothetical protein